MGVTVNIMTIKSDFGAQFFSFLHRCACSDAHPFYFEVYKWEIFQPNPVEQQELADQGPVMRVDDDGDDDVLLDLQSLSITAEGVADAWFRARQGTKAIMRFRPKQYPKYEVRPGKGYSLANLQEVSDTESRISCIMTRAETWRKRRLYVRDNIAGFDFCGQWSGHFTFTSDHQALDIRAAVALRFASGFINTF